jgi:hypothetical protein
VTDQTADQSENARDTELIAPPWVSIGLGPGEPGFVVVTHNGREYLATEEMAEIFQRQAQRIISRKASELVVLAHASGVDLLPITSITPFRVGTRQQPPPVPDGRPASGQPRTGATAPARRGNPREILRGRRVAAGTVASPASGVPERTAMANVPLRIVGPGHRITTLQTLVLYIGDSTFEIQLDGRLIGFIRRTGNTFAALPGPDIASSADWTHWNLWDSAATFLVHAAKPVPISATVHAAT